MINRRKYAKCALIIGVLAGVLLVGCKGSEPVDHGPQDIPTPVASDVTTAPSPIPTPIVDVPKDRYDAVSVPRSADKESATETVSDVEYIFNPFYAKSEGDVSIVDKTQLKLFDVDASGNVRGGIDYPCLAYSVEKIPLASMNGDFSDVSDLYEGYRIVLKEGITFADGSDVTADDVLFSIKTLAHEDYDGTSEIGKIGVYGMEQYNTQISDETRATAEKYAYYDINEDGTSPFTGEEATKWQEVWDCFDEAGILMTEDIVKYVNEQYPIDAYVQTYLSTKLTYSHVEADPSLQILYAMRLWGGYAKKYVASTNTMTDLNGVEHNLTEEPLTIEDFWMLIRDFYGYNLGNIDGLNYESPFEYSNKYFEDYLADAFCLNHKGVDEIAGIVISEKTFEDGAVRKCIDVVIDKNEKLADLNVYVVEKKLYESDIKNNTASGGAGEYVISKVSEEGIVLAANESYLLGSPEYGTITYTIETEDSDEMD